MSKKDVSVKVMRKVLIDVLLLVSLSICVHLAAVLWTPYQRGFFCGDESLMYPLKASTVKEGYLRFVQIVPLLFILICEWAVLRKHNDDIIFLGRRVSLWLQGFYCTAMSFAIGICFNELTVNVTKNLIGRLRPHFFDVCKPSVDCKSPEWHGRYVEEDQYYCTETDHDKILNAHKSFCSGHSALAAFSMIYLALYLESRLTWRGTRFIRHTIQYAAVLTSWYVAMSRISDYKHHWSDVTVGYLLGAIMAFFMWKYGTDLVKKQDKETRISQELSVVTH